MINIIKGGSIIHTSKNLRGMRDYATYVSKVVRIETCQLPPTDGGSLRVIYADGSECRTNFASYYIMIDFVRNRRSWREGGAKHIMQGPDMGYLTKPGIIAGEKA